MNPRGTLNPGDVLGACWGLLGASWGRLGGVTGPLEASWGLLRGATWEALGGFRVLLEGVWGGPGVVSEVPGGLPDIDLSSRIA